MDDAEAQVLSLLEVALQKIEAKPEPTIPEKKAPVQQVQQIQQQIIV